MQDRGKSLTGAADDCEMSLSYMNQLISGKKSFSDETIDKLAKGLKISRYELFITEEDFQHLSTPTPIQTEDPLKDLLGIINNLSANEIKTLIFAANGMGLVRPKSATRNSEES